MLRPGTDKIPGSTHPIRSHIEDDFYEIKLANDTRITAKEMKIEKVARVECVNRIPTPDAIYRAMLEWYEKLVREEVFVETEMLGNVR